MAEQDTEQHHKPPDSPNGNNAHPEGEHLGIAGRMTRAFINSPLSPLLFVAMLFTGIMGLVITPRQEDPQISVPMVDIFVRYPGASAEQVASLAVEPLERIMSEIPGVEHVYSASKRGQGIVTVQFFVGEPLNPSIVKVHDRIQRNMDKIPPGVPPPLVKPKSIDDVPVVNLTLWSPDPNIDDSALRKLALDVLQQLKEIRNTGEGFIVGGRTDQVRVEVYSERLSGYGIGLDQVAQTIRTANAEQQAGDVESADTYFTVYTGAFLRNPQQISRLVVGERNGVPVYVRDVARVSQQPKDAAQIVEYYTCVDRTDTDEPDRKVRCEPEEVADGVPAVTIAIAKKEGANGVQVALDVLAKVEALKGVLIPGNVQVAITRDYGQTANAKVNELIAKLFKATGFVFILVLLAFRALRPALVVLLVIPVVILFTVFAAWIMGYTIDRVSLFALIFSIGILVDDAIVVVENIYRRWLEKGATDTETAVDAVREVGYPTIIATFTVVAALLPMGFVRGMMGPYMEPIPALGSVAMIFSLFAAFIFTPWWAMRLKPSMAYLEKAEKREHEGSLKLERFFRRILTPLIQHRGKRFLFKLALWGGLGFSMLMFYPTNWVPVKMLPLDNKPEFSVVVNMPEGTALPVTANVARRLATEIRDKVPEVSALQTYAGTARPFDFNGMVRHYYLRQQPWEAEVQVQLTDKTVRKHSSHDLAVMARELLVPIAEEMGAAIQVVEMPPGPPVLQTVVAEIHGPDARTRRQFAQEMTELFREARSISDVDNYLQEPYDYWRFEVDTEKAVRRGISVDTINRNVTMAMGNFVLGDIKVGRVLEPTNIVIQVPLSVRAQVTNLGDLPIVSDTGQTIPLAELGRFVKVPEDPIIFHKDLRPVEYVTGEATGELAAPVYGMFQVQGLIGTTGYSAPDGVKPESYWRHPPPDDSVSAWEWTGEWTVTYETFRDMGLAFAVALVLIYILVVWEFGNFRVPALIMAPIPLTLLGIVPGHWVAGMLMDGTPAEFTATSMIGWIALAGIIVRNSILLVDFSIHAIRDGMSVEESVIQACRTRTRPIMITALALVAGSSVIVGDPIFKGMAISLAFGVMVSTILSLVVIPLGCVAASKSLMALAHPGGEGQAGPAAAEEPPAPPAPPSRPADTPSLAQKAWGAISMLFYLLRAVFILAWVGLKSLFRRKRRKPEAPPEQSATRVAAAEPPARPAVTATPAAAMPEAAAPQTPSQPQSAGSRPTAPVAPRTRPKRLGTDPAGRPATPREPVTAPPSPSKGPESGSPRPSASAASKAHTRKRRGIRLKPDVNGLSEDRPPPEDSGT